MPIDERGVEPEGLPRHVVERATVVQAAGKNYYFEWSASVCERDDGNSDGIRFEPRETYQPPNVWVWIRQLSDVP